MPAIGHEEVWALRADEQRAEAREWWRKVPLLARIFLFLWWGFCPLGPLRAVRVLKTPGRPRSVPENGHPVVGSLRDPGGEVLVWTGLGTHSL